MKRKIQLPVLIIAVMVITQSCTCWTKFWNVRSPVVTGAVQMTDVSGESDSWTYKIGGHAGVIVPVHDFSEMLGVRAEINGSFQGAKWTEADLSGTTNLFYLNIPIVLRYKTAGGFFGEAGIQPGFLLSAKDKYEGTTDNYMDYMNKFDFIIPLGIGYEFKNNIGVGVRFIPGLNDITPDQAKDHNFVIGLRGTYSFGKKK